MQINPIRELLRGVKVATANHSPSLPKPTPRPERNKVVSDPTRLPINRQAALLISPMRSWLYQPIPEPVLPTKENQEIERLARQLKIERNEHALTRDTLGAARRKLSEANATIGELRKESERLKAECASKDEIIRQLEDLRL